MCQLYLTKAGQKKPLTVRKVVTKAIGKQELLPREHVL